MAKPKRLPELVQRPNGYFYITGTGADGKTFLKSLKTQDRAKASKDFVAFLSAVHDTDAADLSKSRTVHWCMDFYEEKHCPSIVTGARAIRIFKGLRKCIPSHVYVKDLTAKDFDRWIAIRKAETGLTGEAPITDSTIRGELVIFRAMLNFCVAKEELRLADVPKITLPSAGDPRVKWLMRDEAEHLLEVFKTAKPPKGADAKKYEGKLPALYILGEIAYGTGRRLEAIAGLKWSKIAWKRSKIDFRINGRETNKKLRGEAHISSRLLPILERAYRERDPESEYVLGRKQAWGATFARYAIKAGFVTDKGKADISPHVLRHTFISLALQAGMSIWKVAKAVGCSVKTIEKVYGHANDEDAQAVMESVCGSGKTKPQRHLKVIK